MYALDHARARELVDGLSRLAAVRRREDQHKELGFQVHFLDTGQNERDQQTDDHLDNGDGHVDKLVDHRGSRRCC